MDFLKDLWNFLKERKKWLRNMPEDERKKWKEKFSGDK